MSSAETAYLFRHALLRDAAYQLQLPGDRARLHALAFHAIEALAGGRPQEPAPLGEEDGPSLDSHATDPFAQDLAEHARLAADTELRKSRELGSARRIYLRRAASLAELRFQHGAAGRLWREHADSAENTESGESLRRAAIATHKAGRAESAGTLLEEALRRHRKTGDRHFEALALGTRGNVFMETGQFEHAASCYGEACALHRESRRRRLEGVELGNLASAHRAAGRFELAEKCHAEALAIHREVRNRMAEGIELGLLASLYRETGRIDLAGRMQEEALAIHRETGNRRSEGITLGNLANVCRDRGEFDRAGQLLAAALEIHRETGNRRYAGIALGAMAGIYRETGRAGLAEKTFEEAISIHVEVSNRQFEGVHSCALAVLLLSLGRTDPGRELWKRGSSILRQVGDARSLRLQVAEMQKACERAGIPPLENKTGAAESAAPDSGGGI